MPGGSKIHRLALIPAERGVDLDVKDATEALLGLQCAVMLRERAGSGGDFTGKRQTSPRSGCKNRSSAEASLPGTASCEKNHVPTESSARFSSKYSTFASLWGVWVFLPGRCCGISEVTGRDSAIPARSSCLETGSAAGAGRGCCSGFAMPFTAAFPALPA